MKKYLNILRIWQSYGINENSISPSTRKGWGLNLGFSWKWRRKLQKTKCVKQVDFFEILTAVGEQCTEIVLCWYSGDRLGSYLWKLFTENFYIIPFKITKWLWNRLASLQLQNFPTSYLTKIQMLDFQIHFCSPTTYEQNLLTHPFVVEIPWNNIKKYHTITKKKTIFSML